PNLVAPLSLWREYAVAQGWVAGYIQLSTSLELDWPTVDGDVVELNEWFELPLERNDMFSSFSEIVRRKIRRAEKQNVIVVDEPLALASALKRLFPIAMQRVGARAHYSFSEATLESWATSPESLVLG